MTKYDEIRAAFEKGFYPEALVRDEWGNYANAHIRVQWLGFKQGYTAHKVATAAYDSELKKHIKVLVECLGLVMKNSTNFRLKAPNYMVDKIEQALSSLPEELRGL